MSWEKYPVTTVRGHVFGEKLSGGRMPEIPARLCHGQLDKAV